MADRPVDKPGGDAQWRTAGDRIQTLLDASASGGAVAHERAEQLVREVTDLYGAGLERIVAIAAGADPVIVDRLADDDLVASLLLVHGLHPYSVERRVADALDTVRPYLGSHGGDVALLEVADDVVRLQFKGSCKSCPSSAVTLELAVEDAVRAAAPEIASIEVVAVASDSASESASGVIPVEALMNRVRANGHSPATWHPVPELDELVGGEVGGFRVADMTALACRVGEELFAYGDRCPSCAGSLAGSVLETGADKVVLRCPLCHVGFDVVHAGAGVDTEAHLEPIPLLVRDGVLSIAVASEASGVAS